MIFKDVRDGRPIPSTACRCATGRGSRRGRSGWTSSITTKRELRLDTLLDEDSTFYGDLFPHAVLGRASSTSRTACTGRSDRRCSGGTVLHVRILDLDAPRSGTPADRRPPCPTCPRRRRARRTRTAPPERPAASARRASVRRRSVVESVVREPQRDAVGEQPAAARSARRLPGRSRSVSSSPSAAYCRGRAAAARRSTASGSRRPAAARAGPAPAARRRPVEHLPALPRRPPRRQRRGVRAPGA